MIVQTTSLLRTCLLRLCLVNRLAVLPRPRSKHFLRSILSHWYVHRILVALTCILTRTDQVQLEALPTQISYSFISPPLSDGHTPDLKFARRDLFDARFQLISEGTGNPESAGQLLNGSDPSLASALQFIDDPSDLVPLVYEGGLKTWECSFDLASCLKRGGHAANAKGRRVLEVHFFPPPFFLYC